MFHPLLAQTRTTYEFSRLQAYTERWHYLVLAVVARAIVAYAVWMYRRDSVELPRWVAVLLLVLRLAALCGLAGVLSAPGKANRAARSFTTRACW